MCDLRSPGVGKDLAQSVHLWGFSWKKKKNNKSKKKKNEKMVNSRANTRPSDAWEKKNKSGLEGVVCFAEIKKIFSQMKMNLKWTFVSEE